MSLKRIIAFIGCIVFFAVYYEYIQINELVRFRRTDSPLPRGVVAQLPSDEGLKDLHISGSSRPTEQGLKKALTSIYMPIYIYDLFGEDHYYIDGLPESWYGYERSLQVGVSRSKASLREKAHRFVCTGKMSHRAEDAETSEELAKRLGYNYIAVTQERKTLPSISQVEEFLRTVESLPDPVWIHFHCSAGRNRTTIAMVMYDILKNGRKVPLKDILLRQQLLGSENLFDITEWPNGHYTKAMLLERKEFIENFYSFVISPDGYGHQSWSQWLSRLKI